jgi:hypothetical protein
MLRATAHPGRAPVRGRTRAGPDGCSPSGRHRRPPTAVAGYLGRGVPADHGYAPSKSADHRLALWGPGRRVSNELLIDNPFHE